VTSRILPSRPWRPKLAHADSPPTGPSSELLRDRRRSASVALEALACSSIASGAPQMNQLCRAAPVNLARTFSIAMNYPLWAWTLHAASPNLAPSCKRCRRNPYTHPSRSFKGVVWPTLGCGSAFAPVSTRSGRIPGREA
jgi:hypothetical protein